MNIIHRFAILVIALLAVQNSFIFSQVNKHAKNSTSPDTSGMVLVNGGSFNLGNKNENNAYTIILDSFYIDKYEVTVKQFKEFCDATGRQMPDEPEWGWIDNHPMVNVTWFDAVDYAEWVGKRLPTETEWELAARGGDRSKGFLYAGANRIDDVAWYFHNGSNKTHPVGKLKPNELGIYDMSGNVWEWCSDWFSEPIAPGSTLRNPRGPDRGEGKTLRGGSWLSDIDVISTSFRNWAQPEVRIGDYGFRCVVTK